VAIVGPLNGEPWDLCSGKPRAQGAELVCVRGRRPLRFGIGIYRSLEGELDVSGLKFDAILPPGASFDLSSRSFIWNPDSSGTFLFALMASSPTHTSLLVVQIDVGLP
jgi:hypothetical protein